ncbi:MAG: hypothetical protein K2O95_02465, partial [Clostridia bacterium]|nr:hypothetical protein [Clostridia bacterium]
MHKGLDSNEIRSKNNESNVVITLAGLKWTITSLTQDEFGNPVLTLWLTDGIFKSKYNDWSQNALYDYPSTMYSSSKIRATLLNGVGSDGSEVKYVANQGDSELSSVEKMQDYPFKAFTLNPTRNGDTIDRTNGSITDFLVKPNNIPYMLTENMKDYDTAIVGNKWGTGQNDALAKLDDSKWYSSTVMNVQDKEGYFDWGEDYLWLPGWVETGWGAGSGFKAGPGLWNTDSQLRCSSGTVWLRSTEAAVFTSGYPIGADGSRGYASVTEEYYVRPAIHLNLAKAEEAATSPIPQSKDTTKYYDNGNEVTFELDAVYTEVIDILSLTATDINGNSMSSPSYSVNNSVLSFNANQVGKYVVTVKPKDGECWADGTNSEKSYTYYLKYHVTPLLFASDPSNLVYKGSKHYIEVE